MLRVSGTVDLQRLIVNKFYCLKLPETETTFLSRSKKARPVKRVNRGGSNGSGDVHQELVRVGRRAYKSLASYRFFYYSPKSIIRFDLWFFTSGITSSGKKFYLTGLVVCPSLCGIPPVNSVLFAQFFFASVSQP